MLATYRYHLGAMLSALLLSTAVHYTVHVDPSAQTLAVTARLERAAPQPDEVAWSLPEGFAFVTLEEPRLAGEVVARSGNDVLEVRRDSPYRFAVPETGEAVELTYSVPLDHRSLAEVAERDSYEYPYLAADHGMLVTGTTFLVPDVEDVGTWRVSFALPDGWEVLAPWTRLDDGSFDPGGRQSLSSDLVALGRWEHRDVEVGDFTAVVAVAPGQDGLLDSLAPPLEEIVRAELELFGTPMTGRYLFLCGRPDGVGLAGSPKTRSMTLMVEPRLRAVARDRLPHLVAHEFFHTWAQRRVHVADDLRWLNEGVTDYYAYLVPARLGLLPWPAFADVLAEKLAAVEKNPLTSPAAAGGPEFFEGGDAYHLVYDAGLLVGAWIDLAIRDRGDGRTLDDLMRAFLNDARWTDGREVTGEAFFDVLARFVPERTAGEVRTATEHFEVLVWLDALADLGVEVERADGAYRLPAEPWQ